MDVLCETVSLLWARSLMTGLSISELQMFCSCVVRVCSDHGVERSVVELPDITETSIVHIGGRILDKPSS